MAEVALLPVAVTEEGAADRDLLFSFDEAINEAGLLFDSDDAGGYAEAMIGAEPDADAEPDIMAVVLALDAGVEDVWLVCAVGRT